MEDQRKDYNEIVNSIIIKYCELGKNNPNHKLLEFLSGVRNNKITYNPITFGKYLKKLEIEEDKELRNIKTIEILTKYHTALIEAIEEPENKNISKAPSQEKKTLIGKILSKLSVSSF